MEQFQGQGRSSMLQRTSDVDREKVPLSTARKDLLFQDKHKGGQPFGRPYLGPSCELRQNARTEQLVQSKSLKNSRQSFLGRKTCNDDELVKHMSNLPGFLQQKGRENSIQEKALNFGVLDWKKLEKWKYNERMPGKYPKKISSSGSTSNSFAPMSGPPKVSPNLKSPRPPQGPNPSLLYSGKQPVPHGSRFSSPTRMPPSSQSLHIHSTKEERSGKKHEEEKYFEAMGKKTMLKSKGKETCQKDFQPAESSKINGPEGRYHEDMFYDRKCSKTSKDSSKKKDLNKAVMLGKDASPSDQGKSDFVLSPHDMLHVSETKNVMRLDDELNFRTGCCTAESQNIVLLRPKTFPKKISFESSQFTESRNSLDGQLTEALATRLSDCFSSQELYSGKSLDGIPRSCPLPSGSTEHAESPLDACNKPVDNTFTPSEGKFSTLPRKSTRSSLSGEFSNKSHLGQSEQPNVKGRTPSPTRRFSFSLGKMTRSFSFKESSGAPELSSEYTSIKSGPVKLEVSTGMDSFEKDKGNTSGRGRSSPLRRLLDPLLKHKRAPETIRRPQGSLYPMTMRTMGAKELAQDRNPSSAKSQALLQLSLKNGLPYFKLVVDNSSDMLAAVVKKLPSSGKRDTCMIYTFYSVHEVKKKSMSWITQGSKSKSSNLGYNIVGQMKISSSYHPKVKAPGSNQFCARECVLYGVDQEQADQQTPEVVPDREIAAIVVKNSSEKLYNGESNDTNRLYREMGFPLGTNSSRMVVILPSGVHGKPIEGAPSSLISRWRSGGSCDCGGWDVGCNLRILSESEKNCNARLSLFLQGRDRKNKPVFSLEPFSNGFYSIEMDASTSLIEAFATCVAYVTSQKFSEILDTKDQPDAENFSEATTGSDENKTPTTLQVQGPAAFITCPPLSPAGRI